VNATCADCGYPLGVAAIEGLTRHYDCIAAGPCIECGHQVGAAADYGADRHRDCARSRPPRDPEEFQSSTERRTA